MAHFERDDFGDIEILLGDVVFLESGMIVDCLDCPAYLQSHQDPYSTAMTTQRVTVGKNYERHVKLEVIRRSLFTTLKESFDFFRVRLDHDLAHRYIKHQVPDFDESPFCVPQGLYVVDGISKYLRGHAIICTTYKAAEDRHRLHLLFYKDISHQTSIERLRVIKNPESFGE